MIKAHHLRPAPGAKKSKTRKGRGDASKGKTAGRGTKGTRARNTVRAGFEGGQMPLQIRIPKLRGFKNQFRVEYQAVNVDRLDTLFPDGGDIEVADMVVKGAVRDGRPVKVLGGGTVEGTLNVRAQAFSKSAVEKLEAAGGSATVV